MPSDARARLQNLADALVDDILSLSDEEILAKAREDGLDPEQEAARLRKMFEEIVSDAAEGVGRG